MKEHRSSAQIIRDARAKLPSPIAQLREAERIRCYRASDTLPHALPRSLREVWVWEPSGGGLTIEHFHNNCDCHMVFFELMGESEETLTWQLKTPLRRGDEECEERP